MVGGLKNRSLVPAQRKIRSLDRKEFSFVNSAILRCLRFRDWPDTWWRFVQVTSGHEWYLMVKSDSSFYTRAESQRKVYLQALMAKALEICGPSLS